MKKHGLSFKDWLHQFAALLITWTILSGVTGLFDELYNSNSRLLLTAWLCIGIGVMVSKNIDFPLPRVDRIDVQGAFRMLWWAAFWPRYLLRK